MRKVLFLDRDGTINVDYGYVGSVERFEFIDGIFDFCRAAMKKGYDIIIITNQSGIARGYYTVREYEALTRHMVNEFKENDVVITDVFYSPDLTGPDRKPGCGLFLKAKEKWDVDMSKSLSLGDKERDLEAGRRAKVGKNLLFDGIYPINEL